MYQKDTEREKLRDNERESETHTWIKDIKRKSRNGPKIYENVKYDIAVIREW